MKEGKIIAISNQKGGTAKNIIPFTSQTFVQNMNEKMTLLEVEIYNLVK